MGVCAYLWITEVNVTYVNVSTGNPDLFQHKFIQHGTWPSSQGPTSDLYYMGDNPQYVLRVDNAVAGQVSYILWMHFPHVFTSSLYYILTVDLDHFY